MSNSETILSLLRKANERRRTNRVFNELGIALTMSLPVPVLFKIWDLWSPIRGRTVAITLGLWAIAAAACIVWRLRGGKTNLFEEAAAIDQKAGLHDEIKTAYWFSQGSRQSEWIDAQMHRAAQTAHRLNLDRLYPRSIPKVCYIAMGLLLALAILNFLPIAGNHNWLLLDAAPAFALTDNQIKLIAQAESLLEQAERLGEPQIAEKLREIVQNLQNGKISVADALAQLQQLRTELEAGNLDIGNVKEGLSEVANDLGRSQTLAKAAEALSQQDLNQAAEEFRAAAEKVQEMTPEQLAEMQKSLEQAAENDRTGLEELTQDMKDAAAAIEDKDRKLTEEELQQIADQIEALAKEIQAQGLKDDAADALDSLEDAIRSSEAEALAEIMKNMELGKAGPKEGTEEKGKKATIVPRGQSAAGGAAGLNPSGQVPDAPAPREGEATELAVVLEQQELAEPAKQEEEKKQDLEEQSKQERSKLDYRNVTTELTPAQKDTLNQNSIPWEYRQLIKQYFQALRPQETKPATTK